MATEQRQQVLALSGGVGGARLAWGLARRLAPDQLTLLANTGDDFQHLGLTICPDLDTLLYSLSERADRERGWGLAEESWRVHQTLAELGGPTWFQLGDRDLATHLYRSHRLAEGASLTEVTAELARRMGLSLTLLPMSDDPVQTRVQTAAGELEFQHWFVGQQCGPEVTGFRFAGAESARLQPDAAALLASGSLTAIVLCPSNPFVSIAPLLALPGLRQALRQAGAPVVAVCPIIGGQAVKGPTAKIMAELGLEVSALGVARHYRGLLDGLVIDEADAHLAAAIAELGMAVRVMPTWMRSPEDQDRLAGGVLDFAATLLAA